MRKLFPKPHRFSSSGVLQAILFILFWGFPKLIPAQQFSGELKQWHPFSITFNGPSVSESDLTNPFTFYRLDVTFTQGMLSYTVPGYFAADGNSANTSSFSGNKWRVYFNPPTIGNWNYSVSFRTGVEVATSYLSNPGSAWAPLNGFTGSFAVSASDKSGSDFRAKGWLEHSNEFYYKHKGNQEYFLKNGTDSPENFLAYYEFDNTQDNPGGAENDLADGLHHYDNHLNDWAAADPLWKGTLGKRIIGAINYLASEGVNSLYAVIMNVNGDGREVYPFTSYTEKYRYDVSKLDQWELVFSHMEKKGIALHVVFQEMENNSYLGSNLTPERRLYYREMIARFAHHNAIFWNIGEECTRNTAQIKADAAFLKSNDAYRHPVKVHTHNAPGEDEQLYYPLMGDQNLDGTSLQQYAYLAHDLSIKWRDTSEGTGWKWAVELDEMVGGIRSDDNWYINLMRTQALWGNLMGGGAGIEWYLGYYQNKTLDDLDNEDFREQQKMWQYGRYAIDFFKNYLPFTQMSSADNLLSIIGDNWVFAKPGEVYAVYLSKGGTATLQIPSGTWTIQWYNPRTGTMGAASSFSGNLSAPGNTEDWVALIQSSIPVVAPNVVITNPLNNFVYTVSPSSVLIKSKANDPDGSISKVEFYSGAVKIGQKLVAPFNFTWQNVATGTYTITAKAYDNAGNSSISSPVIFKVDPTAIDCGISFSLMNATTDLIVAGYDSIENNEVITTFLTGTALNIKMNANPVGIGSVKFELDGISYIDNSAPYSLAGDVGGDFNNWNFSYGTHVLKATIYSNANATGLPRCNKTITFQLVELNTNVVPIAEILTPKNLEVFPTDVDIALNAFANDLDGKVIKVEFYLNGILKGTDFDVPYNRTVSGLAAGNYSFTVKAFDNAGAFVISQPVQFSIDPNLNVDLIGKDCAEQNAISIFELHLKNRLNATSYNWWYTGSAQQLVQHGTNPWMAELNFGPYASVGDVCVNVNYAQAPWNKTFCKTLVLCNSQGEPLGIQEDQDIASVADELLENPELMQVFDLTGRELIRILPDQQNEDRMKLKTGYYIKVLTFPSGIRSSTIFIE